MYILYYMPISSDCRAARLILNEKKIKFKSINEPIWTRRIEFLKLNPEGELPLIVDGDNNIIVGYEALAEYLDEKDIGENLVGLDPLQRLEVRRLCKWITRKFKREVIENIVEERVYNHLRGTGNPSSEKLKAGRINLQNSAEYFEWLLDRRSFLSGELFSLADIAYACSLSSLDYLGEVDWIKIPLTKKWYALIKSRPSFRDILNENIYGIPASSHYKNLDF